MSNSAVVIAIDAGTTGIRSRAVFTDGRPSISAYKEFTQYFPKPGWVEHDALEIWNAVHATLSEVIGKVAMPIAAIGITNQRETVLAWDRTTGKPYGKAIVWQDRRTADRCAEIASELPLVRAKTGLVLDPYFSGSKMEWLLTHGNVPRSPQLALGTIDSWIIWNLTGGKSFATDVSNASRTMLFDITTMQWSNELCSLFNVPMTALPNVVPSSGRVAVTEGFSGIPAGIPISGIAGDQQAALFGQACFTTGSSKNTYGTGSFVLMNVGTTCPPPTEGMLTTVAWDIGTGETTYALEGAIFVTGSAIQWLRDGLNIIEHASEIGPLAASVENSGSVVVVPAFTGLGSPWWDPYARGAILGITRGTTRAHIARAVVESIAYQTRDVVDAMTKAAGVTITDMRVDGGAAVMDLLLQLQANQLGVNVLRPRELETTAMGAAFLAGLGEGVWPSLQSVTNAWQLDRQFEPMPTGFESKDYELWQRGVGRSLNWANE
ncbi:MAG: glycerol kinase [Actinomycetota bacterium]|jgi:glycerol kinase